MATVVKSKLKLLYLAKILERETDDEHGLTGPQLIERLAEEGIVVERKTLYRDLDCLRAFGYDIQKYERHPVEYGLASRRFQDQELLLMADAVQSSKFLTQRKSDALVAAIGGLGSRYTASSLHKRLHVAGRIKSQNESVFYNLDAIQRAMDEKRKVEFRYFKYDARKKRVYQHEGRTYVETPVQLIYRDDEYYLVAYSDKYGDLTVYRVDRMRKIEVSEEPASDNKQIETFDAAQYQQRIFGMYSGKPVQVTLRVEASAMSAVIDRFGKDVVAIPQEEGCAHVAVSVFEAPTFYGWLATLGTSVRILSPASTQAAFLSHLDAIRQLYRSGEDARKVDGRPSSPDEAEETGR